MTKLTRQYTVLKQHKKRQSTVPDLFNTMVYTIYSVKSFMFVRRFVYKIYICLYKTRTLNKRRSMVPVYLDDLESLLRCRISLWKQLDDNRWKQDHWVVFNLTYRAKKVPLPNLRPFSRSRKCQKPISNNRPQIDTCNGKAYPLQFWKF